MSKNGNTSIDGLPERSVLYVSATIHQDHPLHAIFRKEVDPKPDIDLGRLVQSVGPWVRKYFVENVVDGTCEDLPTDLSKYCGLVIGCSMHYMSVDRGKIAPWQQNLMDLIRRAVFDYQLPFLGLCGGGQIGLVALGGQVGPNPKGVGLNPDQEGSLVFRTTDVELTEEGYSDPIFDGCPRTFGMQAIHSDYLAEYPKDACVLANSGDIPNQVIGFGDKVRLFGIHPELSGPFLHRVSSGVLNYSVNSGETPYPKETLFEATRNIRDTPEANDMIVPNFLRHFCAKG